MAVFHYILLLASMVLALQAQTIIVPTSYSVVVSTNSDEFGFTYAYKEYYDATQQLWRTDGNGTVNIYNLTSQIYSVVADSCISYNFSGVGNNTRNGPPLHPSTTRIPTTFDDAPVVSKARDIPASLYVVNETNINMTGNVYNATYEYYFALDTGLPVRVIRTIRNESWIVHMYTDWVNWVIDGVQDDTFDIPTDCATSNDTTPFAFFRNMTTTVNHTLLPDGTPFPTLATSFYAVVEGKISTDIISTNVIGVNWFFDATKNTERVDFQVDDYQQVEIYNYTSNFTYTYQNAFGASLCKVDAFPKANNASLLASKGVGTIHQLFVPLPNSTLQGFSTSLAVYTGHTFVRGVNADTWMIKGVNATDAFGNVTYTFDTYVYFFPQGWQFFGRNLTSGAVPMRVVNNGTAYNNNYFGEWDIFLYSNNEQAASAFNTTALGCAAVPPVPVNVTIPSTYSVFISFNDLTHGVTYAFEEFGDSTKNISRIFMYNGDQIIVDVTENMVYAFYPYNVSRQCQSFKFITNESDSIGSYFSPLFFSFRNIPRLNYIGTTSEVRDILANLYEVTFSGFYVRLYVDAFTGYPIRQTIMIQDLEDGPQNFVTDFVDWTAAPPNATVFTKPTMCSSSTDGFVGPQFNYTQVDDRTLPPVSTQFFMVLEGKIDSEPATVGAAWYYDYTARTERIEALDAGLGVVAVTFNYTNGTAYTSDSNGTCKSVPAASAKNILMAGTGFVHNYFDLNSNHITNFNQSNGSYAGVGTVRGVVNATMFTYTNLSTTDAQGGNYTFNASIYFYPKGWKFPARNITQERVPMRVEISGNYMANGSDVVLRHTEIWDLFEYHPSAPAGTAFEPCVASLIPLPPFTPVPSTPSPTRAPTRAPVASTTSRGHGRGGVALGSGAKAAIAGVIIIAVVGLIVGVFLTVRKRRGAAPGSGPQRENRTFEHMREEEF